MARRTKGEGTFYRRKDGRYEASAYLLTTTGIRKRFSFYGGTPEEAQAKKADALSKQRQGIPTSDKRWKVGEYLDYWLENIVRPTKRPKTYETYELRIRLNLKPALGKHYLRQLTVPTVQRFLNDCLAAGDSVRKVQIMRTVLGAALSRAVREELVARNVAHLVELPTWERSEIEPWSADEATAFIDHARPNPLYPAFLLLLIYGLRRGEVLGLRWCDVDFKDGTLHIRQQLQRVGGELHQGPVKTKAGRRDLPLVGAGRAALLEQHARQQATGLSGGLVFTTATGRPIEPNNFVRSFQRLCRQHGLRVIKVHHLRHTAATLLKKLGVPARDTQLILGHSHISVTQEIYQHVDMDSRRDALERIEGVFSTQTQSDGFSRQDKPSLWSVEDMWKRIISGGPAGDRTQDTLLKSSITNSLFPLSTSLKLSVRRGVRRLQLGHVAVKLSRQPGRPAHPTKAAS